MKARYIVAGVAGIAIGAASYFVYRWWRDRNTTKIERGGFTIVVDTPTEEPPKNE